ncbi:hypothetical protein NEMBOFW57_009805 [Staphylotrichum longicolle]|uniref:RecA family profile 1 domain-containing protein n=1 Tax=Staphylotrichum longicolle TaxID=669026 RepID=A0AAD4HTL4_9PEZI|nr:hypothetical protein NEMBOFW57_009805 [Staphylotrichum longicolle]
MTDLLRVLPHFPVGQFARLIRVLEHHDISTSDLLTLEAADIAKRTHQPLPDVTRFCRAVLDALHTDLGVSPPPPRPTPRQPPSESGAEAGPEPEVPSRSPKAPEAPDEINPPQAASTSALKDTAASLAAQWQTISTLDPSLDEALGGGIPAGYVTEITGESGAGKTQFLLSLLLAVQLPPPHGLGRPALYISTEAPLSTRRLAQMLAANPLFQRLPPAERPSLDNIISTATPDLESQDHILTFQVPVEVERRGIGLIVLDSVAANYRAEFERSSAATGRQGFNMGARTAELVKLGMHLRDLAQRHNLAVVVANQVADRFTPLTTTTTTIATTTATSSLTRTPASSLHQHHHQYNTQQHTNQTQSSPLASRSHNNNNKPPSYSTSPSSTTSHPSLTLDHQQRWFTGWGDDPCPSAQHALKTPSLGLVWTTQIAARIAL